jgi:hypothetical protein
MKHTLHLGFIWVACLNLSTLEARAADLEPSELTAPDFVDAGQSVALKWKANNLGSTTATAPWYDRIYLSTDAKLDGNDRHLEQQKWTVNVPAKGTYSSGLEATIPDLAPGQYYLFLVLDAYNDVFESNEGNNVAAARPMQIRVPELQPRSLTAPDIVDAGQRIQINWEAANNGDAAARPPWYDRIYLSTDAKLDGNDRHLEQQNWTVNVPAKGTYSSGLEATIPDLAPGQYYLFLVLDAYNSVFESNEGNNVAAARPMQIRVPELQPRSLTAPDIVDAGQRIQINWEAANNGDAAARPPWYDRIYLSTDAKLDGNDRHLEQQNWTANVPAKGTYSSGLDATIPDLAPGQYYLFLVLDAYNSVFESNEGNNVAAARPIRIRVPDLRPLSLTARDSADPGETIQIAWEGTNLGDAEARQPWYDRIYLSTDAKLDGNDRQLEQRQWSRSVGAASNYVSGLQCVVPNLALGPYFLILLLDSYNNVYEVTETNNTLVRAFSLGPKPAPVMMLALGKAEQPKDIRFNAPAGTRRVEYRLNGKVICTTYGPNFSLDLSDALLRAETTVAVGTNVIIATAFADDNSTLCTVTADWSAWREGMSTATEIVEPRRGLEIYASGDTSSPFGMWLRVRAARQRMRLPEQGGGLEEISMPKVNFYLDGDLVHESTNAAVADDLLHEYYYYSSGLARGRHVFRAVSIPGEGYRQSADSVSFVVTNGYPDLSITREVSRHDNYFAVTLSIRNRGSGAAELRRLQEVARGFQIFDVASTWLLEAPVMSYNLLDKQSQFEMVFPDPSRLPSNAVCIVTYKAVPILFRSDTEYEFGGGGLLEFAESDGTRHTQAPLFTTTTVEASRGAHALSDAVASAFRSSDYLLVTSPSGLDTYFHSGGMVQVLTDMAGLARVRKGVLGYFDGVGRIRTSFRAGDLVAPGLIFRRADGRDQLFIGRPDDNTIKCFLETGELVDEDLLPMCLDSIVSPYDLQPGDAMAVGPLAEGPTWWEGRSELFIAPVNGSQVFMYVYNPDTGLMGRDVWDADHFYETGDALVLGDIIEETADRRAKEVIVAKSTGEVRAYQFGRYHYVPGLTFTSAFRTGDLLASGCLLGDWHDEIVVGDMDENRVRVYVLNDSGTGFTQRASWTVTIDADDAMAVGDVCGDSKEEIVLVDASEDVAHVYGNTTGFTFEEITRFPLVFESNDRLAVGYLGSRDQASVVHLYARGARGRFDGTAEVIKLGGGEVPGDKWDLDELLNQDGLWASQLATNWAQEGFLLLVGEEGVVPTFTANWDLAWSDAGSVDFTDRNYASTGDDASRPELAMGRIPGSSADCLSAVLRTAIELAADPSLLGNRSAYCVSGSRRGPGGDSDDIDFAAGREIVADLLWGKGFETVLEANQPDCTNFFLRAVDRDILYLAGHGWANGWDMLHQSEINTNFNAGTTRPLVYAFSCLTGRYPQGWSVAERFLQHGASCYIGSTEVQSCAGDERGWGPRYAQAFMNRLSAGRPLGTTWRETVRYRLGANTWSWDDEYNAYHCAIIHYFGDPKLQMAWSSLTPAWSEELVLDPAPELALSIPMYTVTRIGGQDLVQIPGEDEPVLETGQPVLPAYVAKMRFPRGQKVQSVTLKSRGDPLAGPTLTLPITQVALLGGGSGSVTNVDPGWWPGLPYMWSTVEEHDGSTTLRILAYPVQATNQTEIRFFSNYVFGIQYTPSEVRIERLRMERAAFPTGAVVRASISLRNLGQAPLDLSLVVRVTSASGHVTNEIALPVLRHVSGLAAAGVEWDSAGQPGGSYTLEVVARDSSGLLLDEALADFQIVAGQGRIAAFKASPSDFKYGDNLDLSTTFANTGAGSLAGFLVIAIQDVAGNPVTEFRGEFTNLAPGASFQFDTNWTQATLSPRNCRILVYANLGGHATPPIIGAEWPDSPLRWEPASPLDGGVLLRWFSVADRRYTIEFAPSLGSPFAPVETGVPATPPLNYFRHAPAPPSGFYRLREQ